MDLNISFNRARFRDASWVERDQFWWVFRGEFPATPQIRFIARKPQFNAQRPHPGHGSQALRDFFGCTGIKWLYVKFLHQTFYLKIKVKTDKISTNSFK